MKKFWWDRHGGACSDLCHSGRCVKKNKKEGWRTVRWIMYVFAAREHVYPQRTFTCIVWSFDINCQKLFFLYIGKTRLCGACMTHCFFLSRAREHDGVVGV